MTHFEFLVKGVGWTDKVSVGDRVYCIDSSGSLTEETVGEVCTKTVDLYTVTTMSGHIAYMVVGEPYTFMRGETIVETEPKVILDNRETYSPKIRCNVSVENLSSKLFVQNELDTLMRLKQYDVFIDTLTPSQAYILLEKFKSKTSQKCYIARDSRELEVLQKLALRTGVMSHTEREGNKYILKLISGVWSQPELISSTPTQVTLLYTQSGKKLETVIRTQSNRVTRI